MSASNQAGMEAAVGHESQVPKGGDSVDCLVGPFRLVTPDKVFRMKNPCPYCGGKISFKATGWVQEDDGWAADMGDVYCDSEPDIDSDEWDDWCSLHGDHDFREAWHRRHDAILAYLKRNVRFQMDDDGSNCDSTTEKL